MKYNSEDPMINNKMAGEYMTQIRDEKYVKIVVEKCEENRQIGIKGV